MPIHHFSDGDETVSVRTSPLADGTYCAFNDGDDLGPIGFGFTTIGAIADLFAKMPRAASEREERDEQAARFDYARDLRKHEVM